MKKIIALSIGLAFSAGSIAQEQTKAGSTMDKTHAVVKDIVDSSNNSSTTSVTTTTVTTSITTTTNPSPTEPKPVAQVEVKNQAKRVAKKVVKKPTKPKPLVRYVAKPLVIKNTSTALLNAEYYYIPKHASLDQYALFSKPINYDDVAVSFNTDKDKVKVFVSFTDKRTNKPLDKFYLAQYNINTLNVSSDLAQKETSEIKYNEGSNYELALLNANKCSTIFVEYHLSNKKESKSVAKFLDKEGMLGDSITESCKKNISDSKETAFYTENSNIINVGIAQKQSFEKGVSMQVHFTKEGKEFFPVNMKAYAIAQDFSSLTSFNVKPNSNGPFFGVVVTQKLAPGSYHIILGHEQAQKVEWIKINTEVE